MLRPDSRLSCDRVHGGHGLRQATVRGVDLLLRAGLRRVRRHRIPRREGDVQCRKQRGVAGAIVPDREQGEMGRHPVRLARRVGISHDVSIRVPVLDVVGGHGGRRERAERVRHADEHAGPDPVVVAGIGRCVVAEVALVDPGDVRPVVDVGEDRVREHVRSDEDEVARVTELGEVRKLRAVLEGAVLAPLGCAAAGWVRCLGEPEIERVVAGVEDRIEELLAIRVPDDLRVGQARVASRGDVLDRPRRDRRAAAAEDLVAKVDQLDVAVRTDRAGRIRRRHLWVSRPAPPERRHGRASRKPIVAEGALVRVALGRRERLGVQRERAGDTEAGSMRTG